MTCNTRGMLRHGAPVKMKRLASGGGAWPAGRAPAGSARSTQDGAWSEPCTCEAHRIPYLSSEQSGLRGFAIYDP